MNPLHVGIIHYKTGGTDGVSLEIDKWRSVIEQTGSTVCYCSGDHGGVPDQSVTVIPELNFHNPGAARLNTGTFSTLEPYRRLPFPETGMESPQADADTQIDADTQADASTQTDADTLEARYSRDLAHQTQILKRKLLAWIDSCRITVLVVQNIWSVALHPAAALAVEQTIEERRLQVLAQHHDFYWERVDGIALTCSAAAELADTCLPPHNRAYRHVVINSLAKEALARRKGIDADIIPNVFDFSGPAWSIDTYNRNLRERIGLAPRDLMILQATRIIPRKAIELAIDFTAALSAKRPALNGMRLKNGGTFTGESRIVLVLAGSAEDDATGTYLQRLQNHALRAGVDMIHISDQVAAERGQAPDEKTGFRDLYSLWDTYVHADIITYPSYWEGWGNQLLEAIKARLPIVLFEYPVYVRDIKPLGFEMISLGSSIASRNREDLVQIPAPAIDAAVRQAVNILTNPEKCEKIVNANYQAARENFSMEALLRYLTPLINRWS